MRIRSMVGLIPLYACLVLEDAVIQRLPGFRKRLQWFLTNREDLSKQVREGRKEEDTGEGGDVMSLPCADLLPGHTS